MEGGFSRSAVVTYSQVTRKGLVKQFPESNDPVMHGADTADRRVYEQAYQITQTYNGHRSRREDQCENTGMQVRVAHKFGCIRCEATR
jgi:hypothetical protein